MAWTAQFIRIADALFITDVTGRTDLSQEHSFSLTSASQGAASAISLAEMHVKSPFVALHRSCITSTRAVVPRRAQNSAMLSVRAKVASWAVSSSAL